MESLIYSLFVHLTVDNADRRDIVDYFGGEENLFEAGEGEWRACPLISDKSLKRMKRTDRECIEGIIEKCAENDWHIITENDGDYPAGLKVFNDSPSVLFVSGDVKALGSLICVSGTRDMNPIGEKACERAVEAVRESGRRVMCFDTPGCDEKAAKTALENGCVCMALAGGFEKTANKQLFSWVENTGAVVSTFAPSARQSTVSFHVRNRLVSRLCDAAIITQCGQKGNSLYVASAFRKLGKPVFASAGSEGCDKLLNDYAYLLRSPLESVLNTAYITVSPPVRAAEATQKSKKDYKNVNNLDNLSQNSIIVLNILKQSGGKAYIDELIMKSSMPLPDVMSSVTELELFGFTQTDAGDMCVLI